MENSSADSFSTRVRIPPSPLKRPSSWSQEEEDWEAVARTTMKVKVYRNLHKKCWSVMNPKTRRVIMHADAVCLTDAKFIVSQAGRERVLREKAKNVHAYACGFLVESTPESATMVETSYNPYRFPHFFDKETLDPRHEAGFAVLKPDGRLYSSVG